MASDPGAGYAKGMDEFPSVKKRTFDDLVLPTREVTVPVTDVARSLGGQDYIHMQSIQCPKHWHMIGTRRGVEPNTLVLEPCDACVKEMENKS